MITTIKEMVRQALTIDEDYIEYKRQTDPNFDRAFEEFVKVYMFDLTDSNIIHQTRKLNEFIESVNVCEMPDVELANWIDENGYTIRIALIKYLANLGVVCRNEKFSEVVIAVLSTYFYKEELMEI